MLIIKVILAIVSLPLLFYLVFPFITVVLSRLVREKNIVPSDKETDFACIITAYQNISIALPLVDSLLKQNYSSHLIYLVADGCDTSDLSFHSPNVVLLQPKTKLSSKVKSILYAIDRFQRNHEAVVIFDPDNLAKANFLSAINDYMNAGFEVVQGQRTAKNLDTIYACADATGEIYKNYIERFTPYLLGSSPTIAGSGMAIEASLFRQYLNHEKITHPLNNNWVIAAEDKILQNVVVGKGIRIAFAQKATVYDEKISSGSAVERQRSRWLYSYFENFRNACWFLKHGLLELNWNKFLFGLITSTPPLFLLLLGSLVIAVCSFFFSMPLFYIVASSLLLFIANIFLVLLLSDAPAQVWKSTWSLPLFAYRQLIALLHMHQSKKDFMHTHNRKMMTLQQVEGKA